MLKQAPHQLEAVCSSHVRTAGWPSSIQESHQVHWPVPSIFRLLAGSSACGSQMPLYWKNSGRHAWTKCLQKEWPGWPRSMAPTMLAFWVLIRKVLLPCSATWASLAWSWLLACCASAGAARRRGGVQSAAAGARSWLSWGTLGSASFGLRAFLLAGAGGAGRGEPCLAVADPVDGPQLVVRHQQRPVGHLQYIHWAPCAACPASAGAGRRHTTGLTGAVCRKRVCCMLHCRRAAGESSAACGGRLAADKPSCSWTAASGRRQRGQRTPGVAGCRRQGGVQPAHSKGGVAGGLAGLVDADVHHAIADGRLTVPGPVLRVEDGAVELGCAAMGAIRRQGSDMHSVPVC